MNKLWTNISKIGIQLHYDENYKNRLFLINRINVLACIVYFVIGLVYFTFQDYKTAIFIESLILLNVVAFFAQNAHFHRFSLSFFLVSSYLSIFYFDSYAGKDAGAYLYFLTTIMSLFILFDIKKDKFMIIIHLLIIILLLMLNHHTERTLFKSSIITDLMRSRRYIANIYLNINYVLYFFFIMIKKKYYSLS